MISGKANCLVGILILVLFLGLIGCGNSVDDGAASVVQTRSGRVSGIEDNGVQAFLGIPYAAPPVGDLRWRLPVEETPWEGVFKADHLSPACPQDLTGDELYGLTECDEDCLYLNIWTPEASKTGSLPVMFWIHGGGYMGGSASQSLYNGAALAAKGVVVVSVNHRLGPLGFLVHEELYDRRGQAGNYGLFDIIAALRWVRGNIASFGGNPDNVTIFGESSGACSVTLLQNAEPAEGLFHRAIAQSGTVASTKYVLNLTGSWEEAAGYGRLLQEALGAADVDDMTAIPADEIIRIAKANQLPFGPVMDGIILSDDPGRTVSEPAHAPMMIGSVMDEGTLFIYELGIETLTDYEQALEAYFGENAGLVWERYPASNDDEAVYQAAVVQGSAGFQEPVRRTARGASGSVPVYRYYYRHVPPTEAGFYLGCFHGSELAYVFGNLDPNEGYGPEDTLLSSKLMELWTSFAYTGVPAAEGVPDWPNYEVGQELILRINGPGDYDLIQGLADKECDFFESIAPVVDPDYPM